MPGATELPAARLLPATILADLVSILSDGVADGVADGEVPRGGILLQRNTRQYSALCYKTDLT